MSAIHKRRGRVLVEFTEDTFDELGDPKRRKGDQVWVDAESAKSFVEGKKVAILVPDPEPEDAEPAEDAAEGQELGTVVQVADDGTETPSVPDADGFHTLDTTADPKPEKPAKASGRAAGKPEGTDTPPVTDAPPAVGGA